MEFFFLFFFGGRILDFLVIYYRCKPEPYFPIILLLYSNSSIVILDQILDSIRMVITLVQECTTCTLIGLFSCSSF